MTQKMQQNGAVAATKQYENVVENWTLYDTVLISTLVGAQDTPISFSDGYFASYAALGAANEVPFFNVRNRTSGLAYNNQDTRDTMNYGMKIFTVGVQFFSPCTSLYKNVEGAVMGQSVTEQTIFATELPKHCSLRLNTNQDERLKINALMASAGIGAIGGGVAQGDRTDDTQVAFNSPNVVKTNFNQGVSMLNNRWSFRNPIEIPRRANMSVTIKISEYGRQMLGAMVGPKNQPFQDVAHDGSVYFSPGMCGIRVLINGMRFVQQRGQLHV